MKEICEKYKLIITLILKNITYFGWYAYAFIAPIFIKDTIKNEKLPLSITSADYLIELADKVLSFKIEDDEDYMDIKCFCEEKLQEELQ